jgi:hypothetical protein
MNAYGPSKSDLAPLVAEVTDAIAARSVIEAQIQDVIHSRSQWAVLSGDCLDLLPLFADASVDHVVADPPYSARTHKNMKGNRGEQDAAHIVTRDCGFAPITPALRRGIGRHATRIAKSWIAIFSDHESTWLWRNSIEASKGKYVRTIPWVRWSSPEFSRRAPPSGSEAVIIAKPRTRSAYWLNGGRMSYDSRCLRASNKEGDYQTEKPTALMLEILSDIGVAGDLVVDMTCGSGTTLTAAIRLGMRCIGIDVRLEAWRVARERCEAEVRGLDLAAHRSGQGSIFDLQVKP